MRMVGRRAYQVYEDMYYLQVLELRRHENASMVAAPANFFSDCPCMFEVEVADGCQETALVAVGLMKAEDISFTQFMPPPQAPGWYFWGLERETWPALGLVNRTLRHGPFFVLLPVNDHRRQGYRCGWPPRRSSDQESKERRRTWRWWSEKMSIPR